MDRLGLVCRSIFESKEVTQRELSQILDVSLGTVNNLVKDCLSKNLIITEDNGCYQLTSQGMDYLEQYRVDGALIMAAGFGSRFVPLTFETPKGLLEVFGERMVERQIKHLHEAGITDITIVVGYLKEKFEYLIDKYQVKLLYNPEYSCKNTLTTAYCAKDLLIGRNMYVLPSDNWMKENMYHLYECGTWYSSVYMNGDSSEWCLSYNKKGLITGVSVGGHDSFAMFGPSFFSKSFSDAFLPVVEAYYHLPGTEQFYWEHVYMELVNGQAKKRFSEIASQLCSGKEAKAGNETSRLLDKDFSMYVNRQPEGQVYEFENLEELRVFDSRYQNNSDNKALELISQVLKVPESEIMGIRCLKSGMTNKSFIFQVLGKSYICRIPGPGTELLINRKQEKEVYDVVARLGITEHVVYFNGDTGYKIAEFYEGSRNANAGDWEDMDRCMEIVRRLHDSALSVTHDFDFRERIDFYEELCKRYHSILFEDYDIVRGQMNEILSLLEELKRPKTLCHIDSVADNFLFLKDGTVRLIDWEYSGMCDRVVDVSMSVIYSYYNEEDADRLLSVYLGREASKEELTAFYGYIALGGFLWSLWAVYKSALGEEFGEYTIIMYRYAKRYYKKIFTEIMKKL